VRGNRSPPLYTRS